jgi:hypothetical protein
MRALHGPVAVYQLACAALALWLGSPVVAALLALGALLNALSAWRDRGERRP